MNILIIFCSLIVSTILSVLVMREKQRKWLAVLVALMTNVILLGSAYWFLHNADTESRLFGIDFHDRYQFVASIPLITYLNYMICSFIRYRYDVGKL